jgi:RNA polymerase sigma-70 factor (ECF subfamily)
MESSKNKKKGEKHSQSVATESFEALVERIAEGSEAAVWDLLERYSKNILRLVRRRLPSEIRPKIDSVDIVQSVWKSLLRKGAPLDQITTVEHFVAYLAGSARLKVFEAHRHYTRCEASNIRREVPMTPHATPQVSRTGGELANRCVDRKAHTPSAFVCARDNWEHAVERVGQRGEEVVRLKLQGLTLDEIAAHMALSKSTVRRILDTLLQSLTA